MAGVLLSACTTVVVGGPQDGRPPGAPRAAGDVRSSARWTTPSTTAPATRWQTSRATGTRSSPTSSGSGSQPPEGGYFSVDPNDRRPRPVPGRRGLRCAAAGGGGQRLLLPGAEHGQLGLDHLRPLVPRRAGRWLRAVRPRTGDGARVRPRGAGTGGRAARVDRGGDPGRLPRRQLDAVGGRRGGGALPDPPVGARRAAARLSPAARPGRHQHRGAVGARLLLRPRIGLPGRLRRRGRGLPRPLRSRPAVHADRVHPGRRLPRTRATPLTGSCPTSSRRRCPSSGSGRSATIFGTTFDRPAIQPFARTAPTAPRRGPRPRLLSRQRRGGLRRDRPDPARLRRLRRLRRDDRASDPLRARRARPARPVDRRPGRRPLGDLSHRLVRRRRSRRAGPHRADLPRRPRRERASSCSPTATTPTCSARPT